MSPNLLLTHPLTTYLDHSTTPLLPTLILSTPTAKILSAASPSPFTLLRKQCTIALQVWEAYASPPARHAILGSLPRADDHGLSDVEAVRDTDQDEDQGGDQGIKSITVQLERGLLVITQLHCGLLLIGVSSSSSLATNANASTTSVNSTSSVMGGGSGGGRGILGAKRLVEEIRSGLDEQLGEFRMGEWEAVYD